MGRRRKSRLDPAKPGTMGYVVKQERDARGWTQIQLAARTGISQSQISIVEGGAPTERIQARTVIALAKRFDITVAALWEGRVERGFGRGALGSDAQELETSLTPANHAKWIAFGQGLLAAQHANAEEPPADPQPEAGQQQQRPWVRRRRGRAAAALTLATILAMDNAIGCDRVEYAEANTWDTPKLVKAYCADLKENTDRLMERLQAGVPAGGREFERCYEQTALYKRLLESRGVKSPFGCT
jgi:transcriptional regulator with XRE-family HTH domain